MGVDQITADDWLPEIGAEGGAVCLSPRNGFTNLDELSGWLLETGRVANQTFAYGNDTEPSVASLYIGAGNYSSLMPNTTKLTLGYEIDLD